MGNKVKKYGNVVDGIRCKKDFFIFDVCIRGVCKVVYLSILNCCYVIIEFYWKEVGIM